MNNIMITGATGFIGSHLIYELINNEYNVAIKTINPSNNN